jgi:hypothetical protein
MVHHILAEAAAHGCRQQQKVLQGLHTASWLGVAS